MPSEFLVNTSWLQENLSDENVKVFDVTTVLTPDPEQRYLLKSGRDTYEQSHIPGAGFLDLQNDYSDPSSALRFTLPTESAFSAAAAANGISSNNHLVFYSTNKVMWSTRMWWMFRVFGHKKVSVLDGGFARWKKEGRLLDSGPFKPTRGRYAARLINQHVADKADVMAAIEADNSCILHALGHQQFTGLTNNYDRPGHIKNSKNIPWTELLDAEECFLPAEQLLKVLETSGALSAARVISYCGGGIAATVNYFALALLGQEARCAVYDGSLSEWAKDLSLPMEVG